jgi:beta-glucosidase
MSIGKSRLSIDGKEIINLWDNPAEGAKTAAIDLVAEQTYRLQVEYASEAGPRWRNLRIGCMPQIPADAIQQAADLAAKSDLAIVFAGLTNEWESEGFDRPNMDLPGRQVTLIEKVAAANPNTIVVLNTGSPVPMPWLDRVNAVLQAWFAGQEAGHAVAAVLFGDVNPSGKLPQTYPRRLEDTPAFITFPGENGKVLYAEGLFVGYRYYDKKDIAPLFPFGYGLSYTTFEYRNLQLAAAGGEIAVSLSVANTGPRTGQEIVQVYVRDVQSRLIRPEKELKAFAKIALAPGETRTVTFTLDRDALEYYDPARPGWILEPGAFEVLAGSSSRDIRLRGTVTIEV